MGVSAPSLCLSLFIILAISSPVYGFGAGNIASLSRIEGQNWRHGDIEDALLTLYLAKVAGGRKFAKLDVKRVYFGNWLRDYSQAVDVGTVKHVSAEAIRILIWVLGFMSFGYGTGEFEVTSDRLGCYQPTEHIDNPLGYAEGEDARNYDRRLRGPVDEERELSIDPRTGLKCYIASEDMGIDTSANLIRRVLGRSIQLGRRYARSRHEEDLYEALRLLGTGLHCLEDYAAHSNYTELCLIELGERDVFPHVGRSTMLEVSGVSDYVYPIVTGTFGGVDFFHSVLGEFSDKTMQSEIQSLEGIVTETENDSSSESVLQGLLSKIPSGLLGGSENETNQMDDFKAKADEAKHNASNVTPREPEEWAEFLNNTQKQIYPVLEWHDQLLKSINEAIEQIPMLPELIENIQDQITLFVFSVLAPYVLPIIQQVKAELETGSSEVIQTSQQQQHVVFNDDSSSNPTHSMLSKDHFSNVLNEPAGRIASEIVKWTVPQLMQCWDDENEDIDRVLTRIISGVFHHPATRKYGDDGANEIRQVMFSTVEQWWSEKGDEAQECLREQLSWDGVLEGKNHKEGVQDCGHGCGKPIALPKKRTNYDEASESNDASIENIASNMLGGGSIGGLLGGLVAGMATSNQRDSSSDLQRPQDPEYRQDYDRDEYEQRDHDRPRYHERQEYVERTESDYVQTQSRYEYQSSQSAFQSMGQNGYGREGFEQEYSAGQIPQGDLDEFGRPTYPPREGTYRQEFEERTVEYVERYPRHERRSSDSSESRSDEEEDEYPHRHHHHHNHHHHHRHHHHEDDHGDHSGSDSS